MTPISLQVTNFVQSISWTHPTWDLFILVFLVAGTMIYGFSMGRDRIIMIMVAVYMALVAATRLPYIPELGAQVSVNSSFIIKISTFLGSFAILFFMLTRSALNHAISGGASIGKWWHVLLLSFLQVGMLISVVISFLPREWVSKLSELMQTIFLSPWGSFAWALMPIVGLLVVGISNDKARGPYDY